MATQVNRASDLSNISGLGNFWMLKVEDLGTKKIEELDIPTYKDGKISEDTAFDLLGKMTMDSVSFTGDDQDINKVRYTDGSVGITLVQDGNFGISCSNMNISPVMCEGLLNMTKVGTPVDDPTANKTFAHGLAYGKDDKMGYISPALVYIEFLDSVDYAGILIPYSTIASRLDPTGNRTDVWSININISSNECPKAFQGTDITAVYEGVSYILVPKKQFKKETTTVGA